MAMARPAASLLRNVCDKKFPGLLHPPFLRRNLVGVRDHQPDLEPNVAERCKNILAANWRGQLTTLKPKLCDENERKKAGKIQGEITKYVFIDGKAVIWIPEDSLHCPNLLLDNRASFIVGHTDPIPLVKAFRKANKTVPHSNLVGTLSILEDDQTLSVEFVKIFLKKLIAESLKAVKQSSPAVTALLESGGHVLQTYTQALSSMIESKSDDTFYRLDVSSCLFVDIFGERHTVNLQEASENCPPLSPLIQVVIEGINQSRSRRLGLRLLCAWYLRVKVEDAYIFAADGRGINILAMIENVEMASQQNKGTRNHGIDGKKSSSTTSEWRYLRLTFKEEVKDLNEFCVMLGQLERESLVGFSKIKANMRHTTMDHSETVGE